MIYFVPTCAFTQLTPVFYMSCVADGVSKADYNRLMSSANDAKKRLEDTEKRVTASDRKLRILEKAKDKVEADLNITKAELNATKEDLIACKVANDEYFEAEKVHQEELSKATEGLTELQEEFLSKYPEPFHLTLSCCN